MKNLQRTLILFSSLAALLFFAACDNQGPAEKAGEKVDNMYEQSKESMEEAGETIQEKTENAGEKIEEGMEAAGEKMEEAGEEIQH